MKDYRQNNGYSFMGCGTRESGGINKRRKSKHTMENEALTEMIEDVFHKYKCRYGSKRIRKVLEQQGVHVNENVYAGS